MYALILSRFLRPLERADRDRSSYFGAYPHRTSSSGVNGCFDGNCELLSCGRSWPETRGPIVCRRSMTTCFGKQWLDAASELAHLVSKALVTFYRCPLKEHRPVL